MLRMLLNASRRGAQLALRIDDEHPYLISFLLSCAVVAWVIFHSPSVDVEDSDFLNQTDTIQFIDLDRISAPKRIVRKDYSATTTDTTADADNVDRATGTSDAENAVDLSFMPNIAPPRPVGNLRKIYPQSAREQGVEAVVNVELLIGVDGIVKNVRIIGIRLSKAMPGDIGNLLNREFTRDAVKILLGARFTPPVVNGQKVPIRMEMPLKFRLE